LNCSYGKSKKMTQAPPPPPRSPRGIPQSFTGNVPALPFREPLAQETFQIRNIDDIKRFGLTEQQLSLNALQQSNFLYHQLNLISTQLAQIAAETTALRARAAHPSAELRAQIEQHETKARFYESQEELIQNQLMGIKQVISGSASVPQGTVLLKKPKYHQAKQDYHSKHKLQLGYNLGDVITVLDQFPTGWWKGELHGTRGFFQVDHTVPMADVNLDEIELSLPPSEGITPEPAFIPPIPTRAVPAQPTSDPFIEQIPDIPHRQAPPPPEPAVKQIPIAVHKPEPVKAVPVIATPVPAPNQNPISPRNTTPTRPLPNPVPNRALPTTPPNSNPTVNTPPPEPPAKQLPIPPVNRPLPEPVTQSTKLYECSTPAPAPPQKPSNLYDYSSYVETPQPSSTSSLYSYATTPVADPVSHVVAPAPIPPPKQVEASPAPIPPAKPETLSSPAPIPPPKQVELSPAPVPPTKPEVISAPAPAPNPPPKQQELTPAANPVHHQDRPVSSYSHLPVAKVLYSFAKSKPIELAVT
jgi:hypothetical protein